jgi:stage III sporulation protein AF
MMEAITAWVKNIILVVLFASFMELLLPNSSMKRFIHVIMGIFIMLAILNPVLQFIQEQRTNDHITVMGVPNSKVPEIDNMTQAINTTVLKREELLGTVYKQEIVRQIIAVVKSIEGIDEAVARVSLDNETNKNTSAKITKIIIYIKPDNPNKNNIKIDSIAIKEKTNQQELPETLIKKVRQTISELYQLSPKVIEIEPLL